MATTNRHVILRSPRRPKNLSFFALLRGILRRFHPNMRKDGARWGPRCAPQNDTIPNRHSWTK